MNIEETARVLAKIQLGDNRNIDQLTIQEWHDSIHFLEYEDAVSAVTMHRRESAAYLMPVHIIANARRIAQDRSMRRKIEPAKHRAPRPDNYDAMTAAWDDPVEFAKQKAIYNRQLIEAGLRPLYEDPAEQDWARRNGR